MNFNSAQNIQIFIKPESIKCFWNYLKKKIVFTVYIATIIPTKCNYKYSARLTCLPKQIEQSSWRAVYLEIGHVQTQSDVDRQTITNVEAKCVQIY